MEAHEKEIRIPAHGKRVRHSQRYRRIRDGTYDQLHFYGHQLRGSPQAGRGLRRDGVGAIEVCGAFGKEWADKIIAATGNKVAVGYVVHNPEQDELFRQFFAKA